MANQASEATSKTEGRERGKSFYSQNNALAALLAITQGINHAVFLSSGSIHQQKKLIVIRNL